MLRNYLNKLKSYVPLKLILETLRVSAFSFLQTFLLMRLVLTLCNCTERHKLANIASGDVAHKTQCAYFILRMSRYTDMEMFAHLPRTR